MKIKVLKGTNQIGGAFCEVETKEGRILIDFGKDLDDVERLKDIEGLNKGKAIYDAVICTHNHQDHSGRLNEVLPEIKVYMSELSKKISETVFCFSKNKRKLEHETIDMKDRMSFFVKDMKITPYIVDHSAYESFMILIEAEGKRILHSGDFRNHGYKGKIFSKTLKEIGKVDLLITEGTSFSRKKIKNKEEEELALEMAKLTDRYDEVLVLMSTTNIDRVTTIQKCANRTGKTVVHDIVLSNVLRLVTQKIPNALNSPNVYVYLPEYLYKLRDKEEYKEYIEPFRDKINRTGKKLHGKFIMNIRVSMLRDIERLRVKNKVLGNACVVYSMWSGYKEENLYKEFLSKIGELGIDIISLHTSGHADFTAFKELIDITSPNAVIPIHTENKESIKEYTDKAVILDDMEVFEL